MLTSTTTAMIVSLETKDKLIFAKEIPKTSTMKERKINMDKKDIGRIFMMMRLLKKIQSNTDIHLDIKMTIAIYHRIDRIQDHLTSINLKLKVKITTSQ